MMDLIIGMTYVTKKAGRDGSKLTGKILRLREQSLGVMTKGPAAVNMQYDDGYETWIPAPAFRRQFEYTKGHSGWPALEGSDL